MRRIRIQTQLVSQLHLANTQLLPANNAPTATATAATVSQETTAMGKKVEGTSTSWRQKLGLTKEEIQNQFRGRPDDLIIL